MHLLQRASIWCHGPQARQRSGGPFRPPPIHAKFSTRYSRKLARSLQAGNSPKRVDFRGSSGDYWPLVARFLPMGLGCFAYVALLGCVHSYALLGSHPRRSGRDRLAARRSRHSCLLPVISCSTRLGGDEAVAGGYWRSTTAPRAASLRRVPYATGLACAARIWSMRCSSSCCSMRKID